MAQENGYKIATGILLAIVILGNFQLHNLKKENSELRDRVDDYSYALSDANNNIEDANSSIEDAQSAAWSSYEDMGYALENLETVDTVSAPW